MDSGNYLSEEGNIDVLELSDVINVPDVQSMMDNFYKFARIPMAIIDLKGKTLVSAGWQEICTRFHRINPETLKNCIDSDVQLTAGIPKGEFKLYKCRNGMWDMATPIYAGNLQLGNLFMGQFFFEKENIDYNFFTRQALKYDFNEKEYLTTLKAVPRLNREDLDCARIFFLKLAESLSQLSYSNSKLNFSRIRLERSQEMAHLGSWELDLISDKLSWTDEVYRIFGFPPQEFEPSYEAFLEAIHPDDREMVNDAYQDSIKYNLNTYSVDHRNITKNTGEVRYVQQKCEQFRDESNRIIRSAGMVHDITELKKTELSLLEREEDLERSQEKLKIALDNGNIGIWECDMLTGELTLDERTEKMFGIEPVPHARNFKTLENMINDEDISHLKSSLKNSIENNISLETIFRIKTKPEKTKYLSVKALIDNDINGKPVTISGVVLDMTDLQERSENLVLKLNEELLRSNNELERFAYVASHDLQEPLRMVTSFTQLLSVQYGDKLDEQANEYIGFAVDGARRMYDLLNGLLEYSRIHTKGNAFNNVDLNRVVENILKNLSLKIKEKNAVIESDVLPTVFADENQMNQLFQNLIANGIKFSTDPPRIHISAKSERNLYLISIRDEGMGIESKYFDKIFQIFQRLVSREQFEGTGIGLAICKRIVERHNGRIWVESELDNGSTFYFTVSKQENQ